MDAIMQALKDAGYAVLDAIQIEQGGRVEFKVAKDGKSMILGIPEDASQTAITEMLAYANYRMSQTEK